MLAFSSSSVYYEEARPCLSFNLALHPLTARFYPYHNKPLCLKAAQRPYIPIFHSPDARLGAVFFISFYYFIQEDRLNLPLTEQIERTDYFPFIIAIFPVKKKAMGVATGCMSRLSSSNYFMPHFPHRYQILGLHYSLLAHSLANRPPKSASCLAI